MTGDEDTIHGPFRRLSAHPFICGFKRRLGVSLTQLGKRFEEDEKIDVRARWYMILTLMVLV